MQHFRPTFTSNLLCFFRPLCISSLCTLPTPSRSWLFFYTSFPLPGSLRVRQRNYTLFRHILLTLPVSTNPTLTHLPLSGSLYFLLCKLITPVLGLAFFLSIPLMLAAVSSFSSGRAYPSLYFLFQTCVFAEGQVLPSSQGLTRNLCLLMGPL